MEHRRMEVKFYEAAGLKNVRTFAGLSNHLDADLDMHLVLGVAVVKGGNVVVTGGIEHPTKNYSKATGCNWKGEAVAFECPASYFGQEDCRFLVLINHRSKYLDELEEVGRVWVQVPATTTEPTTLTVLTKKGKKAGTLKLAVTVGDPVGMRLVAAEAPALAAQNTQQNSGGVGEALAVNTMSQLLANTIAGMLS